MMAIPKTGYQLNGKVPKINTITLRQEFFFTYGLKIIICEKSMNLTVAKGVHDRTFSFTAYPGDPIFDIKETMNPQGNPPCKKRMDDIISFRKLLLIYRLIHSKDPIADIDTGFRQRRRRQCRKEIRWFFGCLEFYVVGSHSSKSRKDTSVITDAKSIIIIPAQYYVFSNK